MHRYVTCVESNGSSNVYEFRKHNPIAALKVGKIPPEIHVGSTFRFTFRKLERIDQLFSEGIKCVQNSETISAH